MSADLTYHCGRCGTQFEVPGHLAGQTVFCGCGASMPPPQLPDGQETTDVYYVSDGDHARTAEAAGSRGKLNSGKLDGSQGQE